MKDKLYLKTPHKEHKDLTVPVTVLKYPNSPTDKYIVYSPLIDNTFSIGIDNVKTTPVDSEYVVDIKEKEKKLGLEPAFPTDRLIPDPVNTFRSIEVHSIGISKRLYIATAAMQGLLSNSKETDTDSPINMEKIVNVSYRLADKMLKQE